MSPRKTLDNPLGLEPYEGEAVTELGLEIPSAGGGFQESLDVDPTMIETLKGCTKGDIVYVVLELVKKKVHMDPAKNHDGWRRVDIMGVQGVAVIEADQASDVIHNQRERNRIAREKAEGILSMVGSDGEVNPDAAAG